jgi:hypothetical protein
MKDLSLDTHIPTNAFLRLFFMVLLYVLFIFARGLVLLVAAIQFLSHLFTGRVTERGMRWGEGLSNWIQRVMLFLTYRTERMPFPFQGIWPDRERD